MLMLSLQRHTFHAKHVKIILEGKQHVVLVDSDHTGWKIGVTSFSLYVVQTLPSFYDDVMSCFFQRMSSLSLPAGTMRAQMGQTEAR